MRLIPDSGHLPHVEKPESVAQLMGEFVREDAVDTTGGKDFSEHVPAEAYSATYY